jgi:hypothetical protein
VLARRPADHAGHGPERAPVLGPIARSAANADLLLPACAATTRRCRWPGPEVALVLARVREALAAAVVVDAEPDLAGADEVFLVLRAVMLAGRFGSLIETGRDQLKDTLVWNGTSSRASR